MIRAVNSYYFWLSQKFYAFDVTCLVKIEVDELSSSIVSLSSKKA
jgi:hypothetical protein